MAGQCLGLAHEGVARLPALPQRRASPGDVGLGQPHVRERAAAGLEAGLPPLGDSLQIREHLLGEDDLALGLDRGEPSLRHLRAQRQAGTEQFRFSHAGVCLGGQLVSRDAVPNVSLPSDVER